MPTNMVLAKEYCKGLHAELVKSITNRVVTRRKVEGLIYQNSILESCFCKACVLPIVDEWTTQFLSNTFDASRMQIHAALRCEGFATPMYGANDRQVGFSSHSRSNSYYLGDKSGRRASSRRSPDFCVRYEHFRLVGEMKYVRIAARKTVEKVARELRDYLSIASEPTSDWGHDFGFGLAYGYDGSSPAQGDLVMDYWNTDQLAISWFR